MEKKNERNVKSTETLELTPEQMDKVSGGAEFRYAYPYICNNCKAGFNNINDFVAHKMLCSQGITPIPEPDPEPWPDPGPVPINNPDHNA